MPNKSIRTELATILRMIGSKKCIEKADMLERETSPLHTLHLRDLELNASNITSIADCFNQELENTQYLKSISFSYNRLLGDSGTIALTKHLPDSISEIGLVNCGIGDIGGMELLNWINSLPKLQMICVEQNNFSGKVKSDFEKFRVNNPQVLVVF